MHRPVSEYSQEAMELWKLKSEDTAVARLRKVKTSGSRDVHTTAKKEKAGWGITRKESSVDGNLTYTRRVIFSNFSKMELLTRKRVQERASRDTVFERIRKPWDNEVGEDSEGGACCCFDTSISVCCKGRLGEIREESERTAKDKRAKGFFRKNNIKSDSTKQAHSVPRLFVLDSLSLLQ